MGRRKKQKKEKKLALNLYTKVDDEGKTVFEVSMSGANLREMRTPSYTSQPTFGPFESKEELLEFIHNVADDEGFTHYIVTPVSLDAIKSQEPDEIQSESFEGEIDSGT